MGSQEVEMASGDAEYSMSPAEELPLNEDCFHYEGKHEVPWDIQK
jgi:trimethylguanosine synthase